MALAAVGIAECQFFQSLAIDLARLASNAAPLGVMNVPSIDQYSWLRKASISKFTVTDQAQCH